jgi:hypothetical protein
MTEKKQGYFSPAEPDELFHLMNLINLEDVFTQAIFPGWSCPSSAVDVWDTFAPDDYCTTGGTTEKSLTRLILLVGKGLLEELLNTLLTNCQELPGSEVRHYVVFDEAAISLPRVRLHGFFALRLRPLRQPLPDRPDLRVRLNENHRVFQALRHKPPALVEVPALQGFALAR